MKKHHRLFLVGFALFPLFVGGLFILIANLQARFRYDKIYFTPRYQSTYYSPGVVADSVEKAVRTNDQALYEELTGLRKKPSPIKPNPNLRLAILLDVDEAGYFQFLYFDIKTYERTTFYIKELMGRWVVVPQDIYYYWDSGRWLVVFTPLALIWWGTLIVFELAYLIYHSAARFREQLFRMPKI